jgi:hypothetical protein
MIKIPDKHIWAVLQKIKRLKNRIRDGDLVRYTVKGIFNKKGRKGYQPISEAAALFKLEDRGIVSIDPSHEQDDNKIIYSLKILPKFHEIYLDYEKKFRKKEVITPDKKSGLGIWSDGDREMVIHYNGKAAHEPLNKKDQYTHLLYYIIHQVSTGGSTTFQMLRVRNYLTEISRKISLSRKPSTNNAPDTLRVSFSRHLNRIAKYLKDEFPELKDTEIWKPFTGGFEWLLK